MIKRIQSAAVFTVTNFNDKKDDEPRYIKKVQYEGSTNRANWFNKEYRTNNNQFIESICEMLTNVDAKGNATLKDRKELVDDKFVFISASAISLIMTIIQTVSDSTYVKLKDIKNKIKNNNQDYKVNDTDTIIFDTKTDSTYVNFDNSGLHKLAYVDLNNKTLDYEPTTVNLYLQAFDVTDTVSIDNYLKRNVKVLQMVPNAPKDGSNKNGHTITYKDYSKPMKVTNNVTKIGRYYYMGKKKDGSQYEVICGLRLKYKNAIIDIETDKNETPKLNTHNITDLLNVLSPMIARNMSHTSQYDVRLDFINKDASITVNAK